MGYHSRILVRFLLRGWLAGQGQRRLIMRELGSHYVWMSQHKACILSFRGPSFLSNTNLSSLTPGCLSSEPLRTHTHTDPETCNPNPEALNSSGGYNSCPLTPSGNPLSGPWRTEKGRLRKTVALRATCFRQRHVESVYCF